MNKNIYKSLLLAFCGFMTASATLTSCQQEAPEIPQEELYIRGFIKKYGLVDPNQDFSSVKESTVTVQLSGPTSILNVYAEVGDTYYRVAAYADVEGEVTIPVDIATATDRLMVEADNVRYYTEPGGTVEVLSSGTAVKSRALAESAYTVSSLWVEPTSWPAGKGTVTINADGTMSDFIDTRNGVIGTNLSGNSREVKLADHPTNSGNYEIGNTDEGSVVSFLIDNKCEKMANYLFTMRTASANNAKVRVLLIGKADYQTEVGIYMDRTLTIQSNRKPGVALSGSYVTSVNTTTYAIPDGVTEWEIRTDMLPKGKYELVLIGVEAVANPEGQKYAGNWGFMKFRQARTIEDMAWIMACEDLGTTDDFDFNDIIIRIESVNTNNAYLNLGVNQWQVVEDNDHKFVLHAPERSESRAGETITHLKVTSLAAGGTMPLWLHFRMPDTKVDYIVCFTGSYSTLVQASTIKDSETSNEDNEWHRWFGCKNHSLMINTGYNAPLPTRSVQFEATGFSMAKYSYIQYAREDGDISTDDDPWAKLIAEWNWLMNKDNGNDYLAGFYVTVNYPDAERSKALLGKNLAGLPPQMLMFPDVNPTKDSGHEDRTFGWEWPTERTDITEVYPYFMSWIEDSHRKDGYEWFMYPKPGILDLDNKRYSRNPDSPQQPFMNQIITKDMTQAQADAVINTGNI